MSGQEDQSHNSQSTEHSEKAIRHLQTERIKKFFGKITRKNRIYLKKSIVRGKVKGKQNQEMDQLN